jgi:hypothetical protein
VIERGNMKIHINRLNSKQEFPVMVKCFDYFKNLISSSTHYCTNYQSFIERCRAVCKRPPTKIKIPLGMKRKDLDYFDGWLD